MSQVQASAEKPEVKMEPHEKVDKQEKEQQIPKVIILKAQALFPEPVNISFLPAIAFFGSYSSDGNAVGTRAPTSTGLHRAAGEPDLLLE